MVTQITTSAKIALELAHALGGVCAWNDNGHRLSADLVDCILPAAADLPAEGEAADLMAAIVSAATLPGGETKAAQNTASYGYSLDEPYRPSPDAAKLWDDLTAAGWEVDDAQR